MLSYTGPIRGVVPQPEQVRAAANPRDFMIPLEALLVYVRTTESSTPIPAEASTAELVPIVSDAVSFGMFNGKFAQVLNGSKPVPFGEVVRARLTGRSLVLSIRLEGDVGAAVASIATQGLLAPMVSILVAGYIDSDGTHLGGPIEAQSIQFALAYKTTVAQ